MEAARIVSVGSASNILYYIPTKNSRTLLSPHFSVLVRWLLRSTIPERLKGAPFLYS